MPSGSPECPPRRESTVGVPVEIVGRPERGEARTPCGRVLVLAVLGINVAEGASGRSVDGPEETEVEADFEASGVERLRKDMFDR